MLTTLLVSLPALAGAWTQPQGGAYVRAGYRAWRGDQAFTATGDFAPVGSFTDHALQYYAEVGLAPNWTLIARGAPIGYAKLPEGGGFYSAAERVGVRRQLVDRDLKLAAELYVGGTPPLGDRDMAEGAAHGLVYQPSVPTALAAGELWLGRGFTHTWLTGGLGFYAQSSAALHNAASASVQFGWKAPHGLVLDLHLSGYSALAPIETTNFAGAGDTRYVGAGLGIAWWPTESLGISTGFEAAPYALSNAGALTLPLFVEWKRQPAEG